MTSENILSVRDLKVRHPNPDAYVQFVRNMVKGMSKNFPAPMACVEAVAASLLAASASGSGARRRESVRFGIACSSSARAMQVWP